MLSKLFIALMLLVNINVFSSSYSASNGAFKKSIFIIAALAEYYQKRFFEKTQVDIGGRYALFKRCSQDEKLRVAKDVQMEKSAIKLGRNSVELTTYVNVEKSGEAASREYTVVYFGGHAKMLVMSMMF